MAADRNRIKKVYVAFMTHFDLGFTGAPGEIEDQYRKKHIPDAIRLAKELNQDGRKRFVWTTGAYLIERYLETAGEKERLELEEAIAGGDISWHGLAFTTHTELMDQELLHFDLEYSDRLDQRFHRQTVAAKMSDVPGHTRAVIGAMNAHGRTYLHIGVNGSSMNPEVPKSFLWKTEKGELVVQYSSEYGETCYIEGMEEALEFVFTGDNKGVPDKESILESLEALERKYPGAQIEAADLNPYAEKVWEYRAHLPVITEEIGDTWIHGTGTDPQKVMKLKRLLGLKDKWRQEGSLEKGSPYYHAFMEQLLLVCEHTWGLDYKKFLFDFKNWRKEDFQRARKEDVVGIEAFLEKNTGLLQAVERWTGTDTLQGSYQQFEAICQQQRMYLDNAVKSLPEPLKKEAEELFEKIRERERQPVCAGTIVFPMEEQQFGSWKVIADTEGKLIYLEKDGKRLVENGCFGRFSYETYTAEDCQREYLSYNYRFKEYSIWSEADFAKPGLETVEDLEHKNYAFTVRQMRRDGNALQILLAGNPRAVREYGCPREAEIIYTFEEDLMRCQLIWRQKDANKMPEALWFDVCLDMENPCRWKMKKMGELVSPLDVVRGGNRRQHCIEALCYQGADAAIEIRNPDSPLVSAGGRRLYGSCRQLPDMNRGFSYCLYNNKWGTNFPMWCEDDGFFVYEVEVQ